MTDKKRDTGAGKGDTPRKVNGEKYRANMERIFKHRKAKGERDR
mgnify:CR=1 FL=1